MLRNLVQENVRTPILWYEKKKKERRGSPMSSFNTKNVLPDALYDFFYDDLTKTEDFQYLNLLLLVWLFEEVLIFHCQISSLNMSLYPNLIKFSALISKNQHKSVLKFHCLSKIRFSIFICLLFLIG